RRRHTRFSRDWSSDVCSSDLNELMLFDALFLRQTHSIIGATVTHADRPLVSFIKEGDFLITQDPHLGLGVMTADCMPIACYDEQIGRASCRERVYISEAVVSV